MGKTIKVNCDRCGADVYGKDYYTLRIRSVRSGKQNMFPAFYVCPKCLREMRLEMLIIPIQEGK